MKLRTRRLLQRIDAEQRIARAGPARDADLELDDRRRASACRRAMTSSRYDRLVELAADRQQPVRGLAAHHGRRQLERAFGAVVREIDADVHGDAETDPGDREHELPRMPQIEAQRSAPQQADSRAPIPRRATLRIVEHAVGAAGHLAAVRRHDQRGVAAPASASAAARARGCAVSRSRLPVGSSASTTFGSWITARAIATRCCSPPEISSGNRSRAARDSSSASSSRLRRRASRARTPFNASGSSTFSATVSVGTKLKNWNTKPRTCRRRSARSVSDSAGDPCRRRGRHRRRGTRARR